MKICGLSASPSDAIERIKENVNYVCSAKGGEGAVREFCDYIIALSNKKTEILENIVLSEIIYEIDLSDDVLYGR